MSFYDDASLIMFPSGYKEDKIYSLKPTDGSGDLDFTRASTATRVNADGLIEKVRTNVFPYSQDLSNAAWITLSDGGSITKTANAGTAPDGTNTASRVQVAGGGTYNLVYQDSVNPLGIVVISGYFKRYGGTNQTFRLFGDNGNAYSGTLTATDTWQRFSFVMNASSTGGDGLAADALNNAYDILVWGMQLETGDIATDYIATTTTAVSVGMLANVPRIDYTGGGCGKLLLEPQRTNLVTYSEQFDNAAWVGGGNGKPTITPNFAASPDGYMNADKVTASTDGYQMRQDVAQATTTYTMSVWMRTNTGTTTVNMFVNNGQEGSLNCNVTSAWQRFVFTVTTSTVAGSGRCGFYNTETLNDSKYVLIWGAQLEAGSYVSSYVPTLASSVTRLADEASKTGISSLIGQTEGVAFVEYEQKLVSQLATRRVFALNDGTTSNRITIYINTGNKIEFYVRNSGGNLFLAAAATAGNTTGTHKIAAAYKNGDYAVYMDGVQIISGAGTAGTIPTCSRFDVGSQLGANDLFEPIQSAILFPTRLTNAELATLTTL